MNTETEMDYGTRIMGEARKVKTVEQLNEFFKRMTEEECDYGRVTYQMAAVAIAAASAFDNTENGGITGFQAGAVMWNFMAGFNGVKFPAKLVKFDDMLYPQYAEKFEAVISSDTWKYLQEKAKENLSEKTGVSPNVAYHWKNIVNGVVPFNYSVRDN